MSHPHRFLGPLTIVLFALSLIAACDDGGSDGETNGGEPLDIVLEGAVQKGPFVVGSSIEVSLLNADLEPSGEVFNTSTINDLGEFNLSFTTPGPVQVEGVGFYYNEVTESLSAGNLTLRALYVPAGAGTQSAYINLITHLTIDRVRTLVRGGAEFDAAVAQAETELADQLALGADGFSPGRAAIEMNLAGGDDDANAYLFAVSATLAKVGFDADPSAPDAELQNFINLVAIDLGPDGVLEQTQTSKIADALDALDIDQVMAAFQARLTETGSSATVPNIHRVVDQDRDGIVNASDNCPDLANTVQADGDGDGVGDLCDDCLMTMCGGGCIPASGGADDTCADTCAGEQQCAPDAECLALQWGGSPQELCATPCDLSAPDCPADQGCFAQSFFGMAQPEGANTGFCAPRPSGVTLGTVGSRCDDFKTVCGDGLLCTDLDGFGSRCLEPCAMDDANACGGTGCFGLMESSFVGMQATQCPIEECPVGVCIPRAQLNDECFYLQDGTLPTGSNCADGAQCESSSACAGGTCCVQTCAPSAPSCPSGTVCAGEGDGPADGLCVTPVAIGELCSGRVGECESGSECPHHSVVEASEPLPPVCSPICDGDPSVCSAPTTCLQAGGQTGQSICWEVPATCSNGVLDPEESDIDCGGGGCPLCTTGAACNDVFNCRGGSEGLAECQPTPTSSTPICRQFCGSGGPPECPGDTVCATDGRCISPVLEGEPCAFDAQCPPAMLCAGVCQVDIGVACTNGVQDQNETDVDCGGGMCNPCTYGMGCATDTDCGGTCGMTSMLCEVGCVGGDTMTCPFPMTDSCATVNGTEVCLPSRASGESCQDDSQCSGGACTGGFCP